jgi:hypothetical protein
MDLVVLLVSAAVFGGVWWAMSRLGAHVFFIAGVSLLAALLVWQSRSLLGMPL